MKRKLIRGRKLPIAVAIGALVLAGTTLAGATTSTTQTTTCASPIVAGDTVLCGSLNDGATYLIEVPPHWNRTLFLYSHGYVVPGTSNPALDVGDPVTGAWLLTHGYALAGSSYAITGWAIAYALPDQISTLNIFKEQVGTPSQTIAWGHSLGGIITAGLIQDYPNSFNGALTHVRRLVRRRRNMERRLGLRVRVFNSWSTRPSRSLASLLRMRLRTSITPRSQLLRRKPRRKVRPGSRSRRP